MADKPYTNPLDGLYEIVGDLWNMQKLEEAAAQQQPVKPGPAASLPTAPNMEHNHDHDHDHDHDHENDNDDDEEEEEHHCCCGHHH